jgi:hypothetical protein
MRLGLAFHEIADAQIFESPRRHNAGAMEKPIHARVITQEPEILQRPE